MIPKLYEAGVNAKTTLKHKKLYLDPDQAVVPLHRGGGGG